MTNFNIRMELEGKSELVTAWSLVRPTPHRVDTHMHARTICKTGIADRIVSKSYVLVHFKASYRMQCCPEKAETLMTQIRVRIRVSQQKIKTPARLRTGHGKSTTANVCGDF